MTAKKKAAPAKKTAADPLKKAQEANGKLLQKIKKLEKVLVATEKQLAWYKANTRRKNKLS